MNINSINTKDCTGCGLCIDICPTQAITMKEDNLFGHLRPQIDTQLCVECGRCHNNCPSVHLVEKKEPVRVYAAWAKDDEVHYSSSSGGVASVIYDYSLQMDRYIVGVVMNGLESPQFICTKDKEEINNFKKSKYLQVNPNNIYKTVLDLLKQGKEVTFIGLPCHCAAIKQVAKDHLNQLYIIDLVCHGTPSFKLFKEYIDELIPNNTIDYVTFRDKNEGVVLSLYEQNKNIYNRKLSEDSFMMSFINGDLFADCCYECKYAQRNRVSDLTIGDFWGLGKTIPFNKKVSRISCVLVNTEKGQELLNQLSDKLELVERPVDEAVSGNAQLRQPSLMGVHREELSKSSNSASDILSIYKKSANNTYYKNTTIKFIKTIGKKIGLKKLYKIIKK